MTPFAVAAAFLGARLAGELGAETLSRVFGVVVLYVGDADALHDVAGGASRLGGRGRSRPDASRLERPWSDAADQHALDEDDVEDEEHDALDAADVVAGPRQAAPGSAC